MTNGGYLASINSQEEFEIIEQLIMDSFDSMSDVWVGGSDLAENNEWQWTDGSAWNFTGDLNMIVHWQDPPCQNPLGRSFLLSIVTMVTNAMKNTLKINLSYLNI